MSGADGVAAVASCGGDGKVELVPKDEGTEIHYSGEVQLGGMLAALGSRMLEGAAKKSIEEFFLSIAKD